MGDNGKMDSENLEKELNGYKDKILPVNKGRMTLERDLYFLGTTQRGYEVEYDVTYQEGCSPTETLLMSVAGCLSIDIVSMLRKMRCTIDHYEIEFEGERNLDPPQYYKRMTMHIRLKGDGITPNKVDRAISLSQSKYCSVYHSLRKDLVVDVTYDIASEG
jgi:putative redox protein